MDTRLVFGDTLDKGDILVVGSGMDGRERCPVCKGLDGCVHERFVVDLRKDDGGPCVALIVLDDDGEQRDVLCNLARPVRVRVTGSSGAPVDVPEMP